MYFRRMNWWVLTVLVAAASCAFAGDRADAALQDGLSHIESSAFENAVADFSTALSDGHLSADEKVLALFNRGVAWDCVGDTDKAIADYSAAIELNPLYAPALNNRANAYRLSGQSVEAKQDYNAVLKLSAGAKLGSARAYAYFGLSALAVAEGDVRAAQDYLSRARITSAENAMSTNVVSEDDRAYSGANGATYGTIDVAVSSRIHRSARKDAGVAVSRRVTVLGDCNQEVGPALRLRLPTHPTGCQAKTVTRNMAGRRDSVPSHSSGKANGYAVQLGSYRQAVVAEGAWTRLVEVSGGVLDGLSPLIVEAEIPPRGRFFRLRTRVDEVGEAERLCRVLTDRGLNCLIVRMPG